MLLYVYRLRYLGERLQPEHVMRDGIRGDVRIDGYAQGWTGRRGMVAHVLGEGTRELVPSMRDVQMRIRTALVVKGVEQVPRGRKEVDLFPQTWVCSLEPIPLERWPRLAPKKSRPSSTGFDAADDDTC
jgi:hypothetical protein